MAEHHTPAPTPTRAVYGFAMYLSFNLLFFIYLLWAIIPEEYFKQIGIDFLPQRYWAVSIPIFILVVLTMFAFVIYPSLGLIMTPDLDDMRIISDKVSRRRKENGSTIKIQSDLTNSLKPNVCVCINKENCWKEFYDLGAEISKKKRIPVLEDLNPWDVSEHLYLE